MVLLNVLISRSWWKLILTKMTKLNEQAISTNRLHEPWKIPKINLIKKNRKNSRVHGPLFSFLRTDWLKTRLRALSRKTFSKLWNNEKVYKNFSAQSNVWFIFLHLRKFFSDDSKSKEVLMLDHHRLLFEDFLELCEGEHVIILIKSAYH